MPDPRPDVLEFLQTRRSRPAKTLVAPAPGKAALMPVLQAGLRVPDHGKLEPWRLVVLEGAALTRLAGLAETVGVAQGVDADKVAKAAAMFSAAPLIVAVVSAPVPSDKIPVIEQTHSAACVCLSLVNAALAAGWGANWLTGWTATEPAFLEPALGLERGEQVAGFIVIGTETSVPPERPRPDLAAKVTWVSD